eukprot:TRINITY_DN67197_c0_g1_i1.p1 TRINITY_DN67197_c0_g1~~TRINITY_DN67197_c0_g1_i1.p1  ORF type:complete len:282 (+),score=42.33 TRINITY_DN67197_c0_g1_i1:103-948(+)
MAAAKVSCNDAVLVISLLYMCMDIQVDWDEFSTCRRPIHKWLLLSYVLVVLSRLVHLSGSLMSADSDEFLLNLRQKNNAMRVLLSTMWLIIVPLFTAWSMLGTFWIWDVMTHTPDCLPGGTHLWFLVIWQVLSYGWILVHCGLAVVAWYLERKLRSAEGDLQQLEDQDLLSRWGQVSRLQSYAATPGLPGATGGGLPASDIAALPGLMRVEVPLEDCPICLTELSVGDSARELSVCGHTFHRACIDLWLYRRADCPLCKCEVKSGNQQATAPGRVEVSWNV